MLTGIFCGMLEVSSMLCGSAYGGSPTPRAPQSGRACKWLRIEHVADRRHDEPGRRGRKAVRRADEAAGCVAAVDVEPVLTARLDADLVRQRRRRAGHVEGRREVVREDVVG